jgi:tetratricopeptide (TPR) repeat protein
MGIEPARTRAGTAGAALACAALAFALYAGLGDAPFLYDDRPLVVENAAVSRPGGAMQAWVEPYPPERPEQGLYRPLTTLSYAADRRAHGMQPGGFHLTNAALHALATALFVLVLGLLGLSAAGGLAGGLLFAAHPVHTEAVSWIVGRSEVLAGLFCFGAVAAWALQRRSGGVRWALLAAGCWFLGLASKESAAPLPAALLLGDALGVFPAAARGGGRAPRRFGRYAALAAALAMYLALRHAALGTLAPVRTGGAGAGAGPSPAAAVRIAAGLAILGEYGRLLFAPVDLHVHRFRAAAATFSDPTALAGLLLLAGLVSAVLLLRRRSPGAAFWAGWFLLFLLPFVNFVLPLPVVAASERLLYIASASACAAAALLVERFALRGRAARLGVGCAVALAVALCAAGTLARNRDWRDPERFWRAELRASPQNPKVRFNAAAALWVAGRAARDRARIDESSSLAAALFAERFPLRGRVSSDDVAFLAFYGAQQGDLGRAEAALAAYDELERVLPLDPRFPRLAGPEFHVRRGAALERAGRLDEAREAFGRAVAEDPAAPGPRLDLGNVLRRQGRREEAAAAYRGAIAAAPAFAPAYLNLALVLAELARRDEALALLDGFERAAAPTADNAFAAGLAAERIGETARAAARYRLALERDPRHERAAAARRRLGAGEGTGPVGNP